MPDQEFTIHISTPADLSGLEAIPPAMEEGADAAQRLTGEAKKAGEAVEDVGAAAEKTDGFLKNLTFGDLAKAGGAAALAASVYTVKAAFDEMAEDRAASETLAKFNLTVEETEIALEKLDRVKFLTGGSKIAAAELFGKVINEGGQELKKFGLYVSDSADRLERFAAMEAAAARGGEVLKASLESYTGNFELMWDEVLNKVSVGIEDVTNTGGGLVTMLQSFNAALRGKSLREWKDEMDEGSGEARKLSLAMDDAKQKAAALDTAMKGVAAETGRASGKFADLISNLERLHQMREAELNAEDAEKIAGLDEAVDDGMMSAEAADEAKKKVRSAAVLRTAVAEEAKARDAAKQTWDASEKLRAEASKASSMATTADPENKERADAFAAQVQAQADQARKTFDDAKAALRVAESNTRKVKAEQRSEAAQTRSKDKAAINAGQQKALDAEIDEAVKKWAEQAAAKGEIGEATDARRAAQGELGQLARRAAKNVTAPEQRRRMESDAELFDRGEATDEQIEAFRTRAKSDLGRREGRGGKQGAEAGAVRQDIDGAADKAKEGVAAEAKAIAAATEKMGVDIKGAMSQVVVAISALTGNLAAQIGALKKGVADGDARLNTAVRLVQGAH